jgi:hypothetical protein
VSTRIFRSSSQAAKAFPEDQNHFQRGIARSKAILDRVARSLTAPVVEAMFWESRVAYGISSKAIQLSKDESLVFGKRRRPVFGGELPHVIVQCPVFKEGLEKVITPTVTSLKAVIAMYEASGGTFSIFLSDGMLLLNTRKSNIANSP